jgi:multicomponent Na+:H+ antiporter subunit D
MDLIRHHIVLLPVILPLTGGIVAFLLPGRRRLQAAAALGTMMVSLAAAAMLLYWVRTDLHPLTLQVGNWPAPFGITLIADLLSALFVLMSQLVLLMGVIYAVGSKDVCVDHSSFFALFLFLAAGLTGAFLAGDIFNLFVFVELLAISSTVLTSISDDRQGTEAAYKYFYMSQLAAAFLLLAVGSLYVSCGTLNMAQLAAAIAADPGQGLFPPGAGLSFGRLHDQERHIPVPFLAAGLSHRRPHTRQRHALVGGGQTGGLRIYPPDHPAFRRIRPQSLHVILIGLGVAGILLGGLSAVGTHNVKRMLAYSTLAQLGFVLVGIGWGSPLSLTAAIVFAFNHSVAKAAMLMLAGAVASRASVKSAAFAVVAGVGRPLPFAGVLFFVGAMGLAGIPPTNGFISKMMIFKSGIAGQHHWVLLIIAMAATLTLVYTMRAFMCIWWQAPAEGIATKPTGDRLVAPALLVAAVIALGIAADPLVALSAETARVGRRPANLYPSGFGRMTT